MASELARAAVAATLARRPHFAGVARIGARLLSRYFDDADAAFLLMGEGRLQVFAASDARWPAGGQLEGVLGYALDVVVSGSTMKLVEQLPPRTALVRLTPSTLAAYTLGEDPEAGERALLSLFASIEEEPRRACLAMLSTTGLFPTDGGAALLEILHWLLAAAMTRDPATALWVRISPTAIDRRLAS